MCFQDLTLIRVNVREDFSRELADWFVNDLKKAIKKLKKHLKVPTEGKPSEQVPLEKQEKKSVLYPREAKIAKTDTIC